MSKIIIAILACLACAGCQQLQVTERASSDAASVRLDRLAKDSRDRYLDLFPVSETMEYGAGPRQDRVELTFTNEHRERQRKYYQWVLAELRDIPLDQLGESEKLTHHLLAYDSRLALDSLAHPIHLHYIFNQLDGGVARDLIRLVGRQPFRDEADYRAWLRRLARYPELLDGAIVAMKEGIATGIVLPRVNAERSLPQLELLQKDGAQLSANPLWRPMTAFPASMDDATRKQVEAEYRKLLVEQVFPAVRRLQVFARDEYLPRSRSTDGIGAVPGGAAMYRYLVRENTSTDLTPEAIHELGLKEVARIQRDVLAAAAKMGFSGSVKELRVWLLEYPGNYPFTTGQQVLDYLNTVNARIVAQLPRFFTRLPKTRLEIRLTDPAIAATSAAQWYPPSEDGTQPGVFAIPVVDPTKSRVFTLPSLLAHEGMPGHHLEGSLARESSLSKFRRQLWINAYGEGWALYAESLGHDMGLYEDPRTLVGRYLSEIFRACRLVVDTGLHSKGWSRAQALRYMEEECASSPDNEIVRYMAWPGQALGYKIGELTILDIRRDAERRLGNRFDIRKFHDALLEEGQLPLSILEQRMAAWIERAATSPP